MTAEHGILYGCHGLLVFRIWYMIREHAIWFKIDAPRYVCTERFENLSSKESPISVTRIDNDMHTRKRLLFWRFFQSFGHLFTQKCRVARNQVIFLHIRGIAMICHVACGRLKYPFHIALLSTTIFGKELHSVAVIWKVAGCQHDCAVCLNLIKDRSHEHSRCRCESTIYDPCATRRESADCRLF